MLNVRGPIKSTFKATTLADHSGHCPVNCLQALVQPGMNPFQQKPQVFDQFGNPVQTQQPVQQPQQPQLFDQFGNPVPQQQVATPVQPQLFDQFGNPVITQQQAPTPAPAPPPPKPEPDTEKASLESISKKIDSCNDALAKIEEAKQQEITHYGSNMEAAILMHNIQRVIQESERMKKELFEKSARIEQQNEKISDLLERNRKFVEDSNTMLEQRNDKFKATTAQAQARVLELENEKSGRVDELTAATSRIASMQMELTALQRSESETRAQLATSKDEAARTSEELISLQASAGGSSAKLEELTRAHREEKQLRKDAQARIEALQEDVQEAQGASQSLEKRFETLKKKQSSERSRLEDEMEELKSQNEIQLESVRRKVCIGCCCSPNATFVWLGTCLRP